MNAEIGYTVYELFCGFESNSMSRVKIRQVPPWDPWAIFFIPVLWRPLAKFLFYSINLEQFMLFPQIRCQYLGFQGPSYPLGSVLEWLSTYFDRYPLLWQQLMKKLYSAVTFEHFIVGPQIMHLYHNFYLLLFIIGKQIYY